MSKETDPLESLQSVYSKSTDFYSKNTDDFNNTSPGPGFYNLLKSWNVNFNIKG